MSTAVPPVVRIATRASQLALWQARHVTDLITTAVPGTTVQLVTVTTSGDSNQSDSLRSFGGLGVFTREVQRAVLDGQADLAVHSLKDLPTTTAEGLVLAAVPERAQTADALVLPASFVGTATVDALPMGATVATGSLRRQAQLLHVRPDLKLVEVRGNIDTRLRKLDAGEFAAMILAAAGLRRLGLGDRVRQELAPPLMLAAVGQGALGIECRSDDTATRDLLARLTHSPAWAEVTAERALLAKLRAGCHAPVGAHCRAVGDHLLLDAVVLSPDGRERIEANGAARCEAAESLGAAVAELLIARGADRLLAADRPS
jgi:hydroxymethylbilane synthase